MTERKIVAEFRFSEELLSERLASLDCAVKVFKSAGGEMIRIVSKLPKGEGEVVFVLGDFAKDPARYHHFFESPIIKSRPVGCGAGYVGDASESDLRVCD